MLTKIKSHPNLIAFLLFFISALLLNSPYLIHTRFAVDDYINLYDQTHLPQWTSSLGRPVISLITLILNIFHINIVQNQQIFTFFAILIQSLAFIIIFKKFPKKNLTSALIIILSLFLIIFNIYNAETFSFAFQLPFTSLSLLFVSLAFSFFTNNKYISGFIFILLSLFSYPGWTPLIFPLITLYQVVIHQSIIKKLILTFGIYLLATLTDLFYIRMIHPLFSTISPVSTIIPNTQLFHQLFSNFQEILNIQSTIWFTSFSFLPKYLIISLALILIVYSKKFLLIILLTLPVYIASFLPHLISHNIWITPRSILPIGALPVSLVLLSFFTSIPTPKRNIFHISLLLIFLCFTSTSTIKLYQNQINLNLQENILVKKIINQVHQTNPQIINLSFTLDQNPTWCFQGITCYKDYNINSLTIDWARFALTQYVTGTKYYEAKMDPEIYQTFFQNKDWHEFSPDQIVIKDNVAYIAIF